MQKMDLGVFAARLKELREEKKLSMRRLAVMIGTGHSTIHQYENCLREPIMSNIRKLADVLKVDVGYLIGEKDVRKEVNNGEAKES